MQRPISAQPCYVSMQDRTNLHNTSSSKFYQDYSMSNSKKLTKRPGANRLTPHSMIHDKQRLYSETMNLKQQIHELEDENVKLKTRLAFFDKENTRLNNYIVLGESTNSTISSKNFMVCSGEKETSSMLINLKKLLKQARDQISVLQESNINLKRTVKYTKINELEIQRKALLDETGRLKAIVQELVSHRSEEISSHNKIQSLTHELKCRVEQNEALLDLRERYQQNILQLQNYLRETEEKVKERESKFIKDLKIARQKIQDNMRKQQIYQNYIATLVEEKENKSNKTPLRCSNITKNPISRNSKFTKQRVTEMRPGTAQARKSEASFVQASNCQMKRINEGNEEGAKPFAGNLNSSEFKQIPNSQLARPHIPSIPLNEQDSSHKVLNEKKPIPGDTRIYEKSDQQINAKGQGAYSKQLNHAEKRSVLAEDLSDDVMNRQSEKWVKVTSGNHDVQYSNTEVQKSLVNGDEEVYEQEFDEEQANNSQVNQYDEDFQAEAVQQISNKNEEKHDVKQPKKKSHKKKKENKQNSTPIDKLTELIALRLKAQQYPIDELVSDISVSCPEIIEISQLADLLQKEPFIISQHSVEVMLKALFKTERLTGDLTIDTQKFVGRLAQLIKPCRILSVEEQELLSQQIHEALSHNWQDLILMLERQQNPDGTVCRAVLQKCLKTTGLTKQHLQMIISDLSLSCQDLQHLEYINLYEIYFDSRQQQQFDEQEPMEIIQKKDLNIRHTIRQEYEESSMSNDHVARYQRNNADQQRENRQPHRHPSLSIKGSVDDLSNEDLPQGFI